MALLTHGVLVFHYMYRKVITVHWHYNPSVTAKTQQNHSEAAMEEAFADRSSSSSRKTVSAYRESIKSFIKTVRSVELDTV